MKFISHKNGSFIPDEYDITVPQQTKDRARKAMYWSSVISVVLATAYWSESRKAKNRNKSS